MIRIVLAFALLTSSCITPYWDLPPEERAKRDQMFQGMGSMQFAAPQQRNCVTLYNSMQNLGQAPTQVCDPPAENNQGCCSWHGGLGQCGTNGRWICKDGWVSSCAC